MEGTKILNKGGDVISKVEIKSNIYIIAILCICAMTVLSIVVITIARPEKDNTSTIALIIGVMVPILTALLSAAVQQVHTAVNSRLTQLLEITALEAKARGTLNEKTRIENLTK